MEKQSQKNPTVFRHGETKRKGKRPVSIEGRFPFLFVFLDDSRFLQCRVRAVLLDVAETFRRDVDQDCLVEFRDENAALLKVRLAADLSGRVELGSTGTV